MDRRRFFNTQSLNESFSSPTKSRYPLEEVFDELSRLYEADEPEKDTEETADTEETKETPANKEKAEAEKPEPEASPEDEQKAKEVLNKLKDSDYEQFVKILQSDGKSEAFLNYLKNHYKLGDDAIKTVKQSGVEIGGISCSKLVPTQQNISLSKSLGMINKPGWAVDIINKPTEAFNDPTITYAGKYIIDGHHRWSKAYALNGGDCTIKVMNFPAIDGVTWDDMLKATQLAIVASNPSAKLVNEVGNDNMLTTSDDEIKKFVMDNICDEVVKAMQDKGRGDSKEAVADTVAKNVGEMRSSSQPVSGAAPRSVMPQTDQAAGSTDKLSKAVIDLTI